MDFEPEKEARLLGKRVHNRVQSGDGGFEQDKTVILQRMLAQVTPQLKFDDTSLGSRILCCPLARPAGSQ
jgi:hypothetical protein